MDKRLFGLIMTILILLSVLWVFSTAITFNQVAPADGTYIKTAGNQNNTFTCNATMQAGEVITAMGLTFANRSVGNNSNVTSNENYVFDVDSWLSTYADGSYKWYCNLSNNVTSDINITANRTLIIDNTGPILNKGPNVTDGVNTLHANVEGELNGSVSMSWLRDADLTVTITILETYPKEVRLYYSTNDTTASEATKWTGMTNGSTSSLWSYSGIINSGNLSDATKVDLMIWINDSAGNNVTVRGFNFTIDDLVPTVTITMPSVTTIGAQRSIKIKCEGSDAGNLYEVGIVVVSPGEKNTYRKYYRGPSYEFTIEKEETRQAGEHTAYCEAKDKTELVGKSVEKKFMVLSSLGGGITPSAGVAPVAPKAQVDISTIGAKGVISGKEGESKTITLDGEKIHKVFFSKIELKSVTLEIESEPLVVKLNLQESKEVDLDRDGEVETKITLDSIKDEKASISMERISVAPKEGEEAVAPEKEVSSKTALWVTLIVILVIIIVVYFAVKGKKRRY